MTPIETFKAAKLEPRHVAKLLKVSRVTASTWLNGHVEPHTLITPKLDKLAVLVQRAMEAGELPFPPGVARQDQVQYLTGVLRKHTEGV